MSKKTTTIALSSIRHIWFVCQLYLIISYHIVSESTNSVSSLKNITWFHGISCSTFAGEHQRKRKSAKHASCWALIKHSHREARKWAAMMPNMRLFTCVLLWLCACEVIVSTANRGFPSSFSHHQKYIYVCYIQVQPQVHTSSGNNQVIRIH